MSSTAKGRASLAQLQQATRQREAAEAQMSAEERQPTVAAHQESHDTVTGDLLRDRLCELQARRAYLIWGDTSLTDPAVVAELADVQRQISRLMTSYDMRSLVAETRRALDRQCP
jgi:hypothetical protein